MPSSTLRLQNPMNTRFLFAALLALTVVQAPAQQPAAPVPSPAVQPAPAMPVPIFINMFGQINEPRRIALPKGSGLLDAIAAAGGLTRIANAHKITIIHKTAGPKPDAFKIDLAPILEGTSKDILLRDGDTVVIPESLF